MSEKLTPTESVAVEQITHDAAYLWAWLEDIQATDGYAFRCIERIRYNRDVLAGLTNKPFEEARKEELEYIEKTYG
jgi:hypothetical protein